MGRFHFIGDESGAVLVEVAVMLTLFFVFILGSIDFLMIFYQWNAGAKAVALGARLAAVSNPVASGLNSLSAVAVNAEIPPGAVMPAFDITCDGATATCICEGACIGMGSYDAAAMNTIVFGRNRTSCGGAASHDRIGMCNILAGITPANVTISYNQTGIGYAGRPGGPAPTITLALKNIRFQLFFLGNLFGTRWLQMPPLTTSIMAEDLSSGAPLM
jgi:Flp pilus assembly protein TadG